MGEIPEMTRLLRNLKDAGCVQEDIERFLELEQEGKNREQLRLLSLHRSHLLDQLHVSQQQIDCLNYLIYNIKNKQ